MKRIVISIGLSLACAMLSAHDTWLQPTSMSVAPGSTVTLDLTSGMEFPAPEAAVKPGRLAAARCRLAGKVTDISENTPAEKALELRFRAQSAGIATIWANPNRARSTSNRRRSRSISRRSGRPKRSDATGQRCPNREHGGRATVNTQRPL